MTLHWKYKIVSSSPDPPAGTSLFARIESMTFQNLKVNDTEDYDGRVREACPSNVLATVLISLFSKGILTEDDFRQMGFLNHNETLEEGFDE